MYALVYNSTVQDLNDTIIPIDEIEPTGKFKHKYQWVLVTAQTGPAQLASTYENGVFTDPATPDGPGTVFTPRVTDDIIRISDMGISRVTGAGWSNKLSLVAENLPQGTYKFSWCYSWNSNSTNSDFQAEIDRNTYTIMTHRQEPQDSGGSFATTGSDQQFIQSGFDYMDLVGDNTFTLWFRNTKNGVYASIWNVHLELWRIG